MQGPPHAAAFALAGCPAGFGLPGFLSPDKNQLRLGPHENLSANSRTQKGGFAAGGLMSLPLKEAAMDTALAVIDMQNDFVLPDAPLRVAGAEASVPVIRALLDTARKRGWHVFHVIREHLPDGSDVEAFRMPMYGAGQGACVSGAPGASIVSALTPLPGEKIIRKRRFSAFFHTEFDLVLRSLGVRTLVLAGTQYPNCVRGTAVDGMSLDYRVIVVTDACSAQSEEIAAANIRDMRNMSIACVPLSDLDAALAADPADRKSVV